MMQPSSLLPTALMLVVFTMFGTGAWRIVSAQGREADVVSAEVAEMRTVLIPVQGMSCAVCAGSIRKTLQSIDGVQKAEVDLERREARVRYEEGKVSPEQLVAAIGKLGFTAGTPIPGVP